MADVFVRRREQLQNALREQGIGIAVFEDRLDQYYFSGTMQSNYLIVPAQGNAFHLARKAKERIGRESVDLDTHVFRNTQDILAALSERDVMGSLKVGLNYDVTTLSSGERWKRMLPVADWVDVGGIIRSMRRAKMEGELAFLRRAGTELRSIPDWAETAIRQGCKTELTIAAEIEYRLRQAGHGGVVRLSRAETETVIGLVVAGENANSGSRFEGVCAGTGLGAAVPFGPSEKTIAPGEPIELDYVMNYQGYHVDQTRMMTWGKQPSSQALKAYQDMVEILSLLEENLKPGAIPEDLYQMAANEANRLGWEPYFMGYGGEKVYFVGHGIGLTLDEEPFIAPRYRLPLAAGMVVAMEPKVMIPGVGVVGIEDTYIITDSGAERITIADRNWRIVE